MNGMQFRVYRRLHSSPNPVPSPESYRFECGAIYFTREQDLKQVQDRVMVLQMWKLSFALKIFQSRNLNDPNMCTSRAKTKSPCLEISKTIHERVQIKRVHNKDLGKQLTSFCTLDIHLHRCVLAPLCILLSHLKEHKSIYYGT